MPDVVDDGAHRRKANAARNDEQVFSFQLCVDGEAISVRPPDGNLLTGFHPMQPVGQYPALFDAEFHIFRVGG
jgi:hypothetical protein